MADETEYFWDESTGMYYYFDVEQDAYVPYVEEEAVEGGESNEGYETAYPAVEEEGLDEGEEESGADNTEQKQEPIRTAGEITESDATSSAIPLSLNRGVSRRHSFGEDGGLSGLAAAVKGRESRLSQAHPVGLEDTRTPAPSPALTRTGTLAQSDLNAAAADMFNPAARKNRKTTLRFGTRDFGNPNADNSLAQMLERQLNVPGRTGHRASYGGEFETKPL